MDKNSLLKKIKSVIFSLADWLLPKECVGCGIEGIWLCDKCQTRISRNLWQTCLVCGAETQGAVCANHHWSVDKILAVADYRDDLIKDLIQVCKYKFSQEAGQELALLLIEFCRQQVMFKSDMTVMATPLSRQRKRWRGFNQSEILAKAVAGAFNLNYDNKNLLKIKHTKPQVSLKANARWHNLNNCFVWRGGDLQGQTILLIDDVATTGATLNECARVLKEAGARRVWGLVIAR